MVEHPQPHLQLQMADRILAIADLVVKFENQQYMTMHEIPYAGTPSAEIDLAWRALLADMNTLVTEKELEQHDQMSVELPEGGYLAWLGVFHQLHCMVSPYVML